VHAWPAVAASFAHARALRQRSLRVANLSAAALTRLLAQGFNIKSLVQEGFKLNVWDIGGARPRCVWRAARRLRAVFAVRVRGPRRPPNAVGRRPEGHPRVLAKLLREHRCAGA
jgi:hypothetical protein